MRVLVTGNLGYIGSVLTTVLVEQGYDVTGLDTSFYEGILATAPSNTVRQIIKDTRHITPSDLENIDVIIHLAALSNDPLGEFNPSLTDQINLNATVQLAQIARNAGVKRFIFVSSQSMYGIAKGDQEVQEDLGEKNPVTAYARTKWEAECALLPLQREDFTLVFFRPSTVYGASPKLRCDIVFNNLLACAYTTGKIEIKSDGSPWRPVVHVRDVCNALIAGIEAPAALVASQAFNIGIKNGNYTVREIAEAAQRIVKGSTLIFTGEHNTDVRTYKVSFSKIHEVLGEYYHPQWDLDKGGVEMVALFDQVGFNEEMFRGRLCNRLPQLKHLISLDKLDNNLFWTHP
jgi:nucleoside-diphosphate-sugar epimerase